MNRKNTFIILGLSLPILMIILIALTIYIPNLSYHPKFNFIYSLDRQYGAETYFVQNSQIAIVKANDPKTVPSQLFLYDMASNRSQAISFEQAGQVKLNPNPISPDGYQVEKGNSGGGVFPFLFMTEDRGNVYMNGHNASQKLNIGTYQNSYWGFHFIGWLMP